MPETRQGKKPHRRPHPQPMAASFLEFDLERELAGLQSEGPPASGQNAKTLVKHDDFRIILMALEAKARMEKHQNAGRISIHTLRGRIRVRAMERTFDLRAGSILALDRRLPHDVEALEDSAVLLTIAWPGRDESGPRPKER